MTPEGGRYYETPNGIVAIYPSSILTKEEFEATLANAADNVSNRYRKAIADAPLEFTATRDIIANPSRFQQNYMAAAMVNWKKVLVILVLFKLHLEKVLVLPECN